MRRNIYEHPTTFLRNSKHACTFLSTSAARFHEQELNIPLTALSCAEEDIPTTLALWCGHCSAHAGAAPGHGKIATPPATTTPAMATSPVSPIDGRVHIAITDECYHPRQLWLAELAAKALPGVALYTVDSCSCCPVNTFHGGRATSASGRGTAASKEEYRHAQVSFMISGG